MTNPRKTMDGPVYVGMPLDPPQPVVGCPVCSRAAQDRETARAQDDPSAVTDAHVVIRSHPHGARSTR